MAKKDFKDLLGKKSPSELRKGIQQIDILKEAEAALKSSPEKQIDKSEDKSSSIKDSEKVDEQYQSVKGIDVLHEEKRGIKTDNKNVVESSVVDSSVNQIEISDLEKHTIKPKKSIEDKKRSTKASNKTDRTNRSTSRRKPKVFTSRDIQAVLEVDKRQTERYSFEIYSDQKEDIQAICDLYEKATDKKLSASRLIREVLDTFLPEALKTFEANAKENTEE